MDWYNQIVERMKELEYFQNLRNNENIIRAKSIDDLKVAEPSKINSIVISNEYHGEAPDLSLFVNLKSFSSFVALTWEYYANAPIGLKKLYITVQKEDKPISLSFEELEDLSIYVNDTYESFDNKIEKYFYDFTGCPNIVSLTIMHWSALDFSSIRFLRNLKELTIGYILF